MNARATLPAVRLVEPATGSDEKSWGNIFPRHRFEGIDAAAFKAWFPQALSRYLRENYASPMVVAAVFTRDLRTAQNWWEGRNIASGDVVGLVFLTMPGAIAWFMSEWAREAA
jgi:hypothetical protein